MGRKEERKVRELTEKLANKDNNFSNRHLDSLAAIFAIQRPCAAIAKLKNTDTFVLSFNESPNEFDKQHIKTIANLLNTRDNTGLITTYLLFNPSWFEDIKRLTDSDIDKLLKKKVKPELGDLIETTRNVLSKFIDKCDDAKQDITRSYITPLTHIMFNHSGYLNDIKEVELFQSNLTNKLAGVKEGIQKRDILFREIKESYTTTIESLLSIINSEKKYFFSLRTQDKTDHQGEKILEYFTKNLANLILRPLQDVTKTTK